MKIIKKVLLLSLLLVLAISCGSTSSSNKGKTLTFNVEAEPTSLDPQILTDLGAFMVTDLAYEGLVRLDEKNEVIPAGAESWTASEDGKVYTFKLRQNAKWSNGDPLTAHDFVRGMKRGLEPATAAEYSFIMYYIEGAEEYNTGKLTDFNKVGIKALDDYTIEIKLSKPAPYFLKTLIMPIYFPLNEKAFKEYGEKYATEANNSIYNGAYTIKEWVHSNKVVLEKNPNYWNKDNVKVDKIVAMMVADYDAATNLFQNKELDLTKVSVEKLESFKDKPVLQKRPDGRVYFLGFNTKNPILKNKKVREALTLAINREQLVKEVLNGVGTQASGPIAGGMPGINGDFRKENGNLYEKYKDVDVKKLFEEGLKELGITPDKVNLTLTIDEKGTAKKEAEFYQAQWKEKLGIDVNVEMFTYKERIAKAKEGNFEIVRYAWGPDYADAMTYLEIFLSNAGDLNFTKYNNPEYDKLVKLAQVNQDKKTRVEAMQKAEQILVDDFIYAGLYYQDGLYLINTDIKDLFIRPVGSVFDFHNVKIEK